MTPCAMGRSSVLMSSNLATMGKAARTVMSEEPLVTQGGTLRSPSVRGNEGALTIRPARSCGTPVAPRLHANWCNSLSRPLEALFVSPGGVMGPLAELLATDHRQTLEFFVSRLGDVSEPTVDREELLYNASVLAHYAQVSTQDGVEWPAPATLSDVFDHFVSDTTLLHDSVMMEVAGTQCLFLAGFFEDQTRRRHNIRWYAALGSGFFSQAAVHERSSHKARILDAIARGFEPWRQRHARLSRALRDQPYLLIPS
jgi:hypothetical protein